MTIISFRYLVEPGGSSGVGIGLGLDNLLWLLAVCVLAAGAHILFGWVELPTALAAHRPILFSGIAGLFGALSAAWALTTLSRLN